MYGPVCVIRYGRPAHCAVHNSESSKGQIININLPHPAKVYFVLVYGDFIVVAGRKSLFQFGVEISL